MKLYKALLLLALLWGAAFDLAAQTAMSDTQVMQFMIKENEKGTPRTEIVTKLIERGVSIEQIRRIKDKYDKQQNGEVIGAKNISGAGSTSRMRSPNGDEKDPKGQNQRPGRRDQEDVTKMSDKQRALYEQRRDYNYLNEIDGLLPDSLEAMGYWDDEDLFSQTPVEKQVFGRNIFNNRLLSFEPNMNIATPSNYRLGPGDAVFVDVWGASQERFECTVTPDGTILIDNYGPVTVDGLTVAQANQRLKSTLGSRYSGSNVRLTVGQTRTITIDVMGEVMVPGSYTLSAFATVFNALYMAGGTNEIGTLRNIRIYRNGKLISTCDIYDYILNGNMKGNVRLTSGDVIIVEPYECLVQVTGKVKRPMYYEMKQTESVGTLLKYAGGFTGDAYQSQVRLMRKAGGKLSVYSVDDFDRNAFQLMDGDSVSVDSVLQRYSNMVEAKGALMRPGMFQMDGNITTVRQLIEAAGGLSEDAFTARGLLHRRKEDRSLEALSFDVKGIMDHTVADISLRNEDVLYIASQKSIQEERVLTIHGEVNYPGTYEFAENTTIEDFILQAGGLKDAASTVKVDISRRIRDHQSIQSKAQVAQSYTFALKEGFVIDGTRGFVLEPFDEVFVRRSPGYVEQQHVSVSGEVAFEGTYVLANKGMRLTDLIREAGGLTDEAYAAGAHLERTLTPEEKIKQETMLKMAVSGDSLDMSQLEMGDVQMVGINLDEAMKNPGNDRWDIVLREGDKLVVPQYSNTVSINGQVMYPNSVAYRKGAKLSFYIEQAGGYGLRAKRRRVFAVNMNGTVTRVRSSKDITPGCTILVPAKSRRKNMSFSEILSLGTMTATLGTVIATLVK
ncbi:MAG: SLBB domain-containing protein [Alloprevotella sp.]